MSPDDTNRLIDEYEQDVDEIIAACRGDLRGAVKALMLINEQLDRTLRELSAVLIERADENRPAHLGSAPACTRRSCWLGRGSGSPA
jgi:hypothetical protein